SGSTCPRPNGSNSWGASSPFRRPTEQTSSPRSWRTRSTAGDPPGSRRALSTRLRPRGGATHGVESKPLPTRCSVKRSRGLRAARSKTSLHRLADRIDHRHDGRLTGRLCAFACVEELLDGDGVEVEHLRAGELPVSHLVEAERFAV